MQAVDACMLHVWPWASGGAFVGLPLEADDAANVFGPTAEAGAITMGSRGFVTYEGIGAQTAPTGFVTVLAAGLPVAPMTLLGLPVSSMQAVVRALVGSDIVAGKLSFAQDLCIPDSALSEEQRSPSLR